jgi:hypothetical protein
MKVLCLALALSIAVQAAGSHATAAAQLFDRGLTFSQFLAQATAQRQVWLTNAARKDIAPDNVERLERVRSGLRLLIVAEDWCPDSVHTVPYIANLAAAAGVEIRIVDRTAGDALMAQHRTRDGRKVTPTVVLLRNDRDVGAWVERPAVLQALFFSMATDPESARQFADRPSWYEHDRGRTTIDEVIALAEQTAPHK